MIAPEEWQRIPLEARLCEHANHTDDELLRDDLIAAIRKLDDLSAGLLETQKKLHRLKHWAYSLVDD